MSKRILFMTMSLFFLSTLTLWAQFQDPRHAGITTVSVAQEAKDDTWVTLSGSILRQVGEERYLFQDATGTIIVDIDHEDWGKVTANPETTLRISGEIDREWWTTEVEVERVETEQVSNPGLSQFQPNSSNQTNPINGAQISSQTLSLLQLH
ncbi:MAG: NirD/YgiW/YdeI family stress tolerance protein [Nitrospira sp.]|nr:NirD/YgiW/YdeI family stress tolerance protein [Nitrospira sp.]